MGERRARARGKFSRVDGDDFDYRTACERHDGNHEGWVYSMTIGDDFFHTLAWMDASVWSSLDASPPRTSTPAHESRIEPSGTVGGLASSDSFFAMNSRIFFAPRIFGAETPLGEISEGLSLLGERTNRVSETRVLAPAQGVVDEPFRKDVSFD